MQLWSPTHPLQLSAHNFHLYNHRQLSLSLKEQENEVGIKGSAEGKQLRKGTRLVISDSFRLILLGYVPERTKLIQQIVSSYTSMPTARPSVTHTLTCVLGGIS